MGEKLISTLHVLTHLILMEKNILLLLLINT